MGAQQPNTEDGLGENVKHCIGDDFGVDSSATRAVSNSPNAEKKGISLSIFEFSSALTSGIWSKG